MIEENNKNKLLIKFNNFDTVNKFFKDLKNLILDNQIENLTQLLAHDIRGIVRLFDNSVDRQEKYIVGLIYYTTLLGKKSSSFNLDLISKWNHTNSELKNDFLKLISCNKPINQLGSFDYLNELQTNGRIDDDSLQKTFKTIEIFLDEFLKTILLFEEEKIKIEVTKKMNNLITISKIKDYRISIVEYRTELLRDLQFSIQDNKMLIENPESIKELILKSEKDIISSNPEFVLKFLKLYDFIKKQYEVIEKSIEVLKQEDDVQYINEWANAIRSQIGSYNISYINCAAMISFLVSERLVYFYELYKEFENLDVFNTSFENTVMDSLKVIENEMINLNENISIGYAMIESKLNQIINGISSLNQAMNENIKAIYNLEKRMASNFQSLEKSFAKNTSDLAHGINEHLVKIDSNIGFNNLISVVGSRRAMRLSSLQFQ